MWAACANRRLAGAAMRLFLTEMLDELGSPAAALLPIDLLGFPYRRTLRLIERFEAEALRMAAEPAADGLVVDLLAEPREASRPA